MFGNVVVMLPCLFIFQQLIWYMVICFWSLRGLFVCLFFIYMEKELLGVNFNSLLLPHRSWELNSAWWPSPTESSKICLRNSWRHHAFSCNSQWCLCETLPQSSFKRLVLQPFLLIRGDWETFQNLWQVPRQVNHPSYHLEKVGAATSPLSC